MFLASGSAELIECCECVGDLRWIFDLSEKCLDYESIPDSLISSLFPNDVNNFRPNQEIFSEPRELAWNGVVECAASPIMTTLPLLYWGREGNGHA
jgi:hypothetical protein